MMSKWAKRGAKVQKPAPIGAGKTAELSEKARSWDAGLRGQTVLSDREKMQAHNDHMDAAEAHQAASKREGAAQDSAARMSDLDGQATHAANKEHHDREAASHIANAKRHAGGIEDRPRDAKGRFTGK